MFLSEARRGGPCIPSGNDDPARAAGCLDLAMSPEERRILRAMTPEQKLKAIERLYWTARSLKAAWLRQQHPEWSEDEVQREVREIFLNVRI